jgi:hypothetical protein
MRPWKKKKKSEESTRDPLKLKKDAETRLGLPGQQSFEALSGFPVLLYDGTNAEAIVKALFMKEGDGVIILDENQAMVVRESQLNEIREEIIEDYKFRWER